MMNVHSSTQQHRENAKMTRTKMFQKIRRTIANVKNSIIDIVKRNIAKMRNAIENKRNTRNGIIAENFIRGFIRGAITYLVIYVIVVLFLLILEIIFAFIVMAFGKDK